MTHSERELAVAASRRRVGGLGTAGEVLRSRLEPFARPLSIAFLGVLPIAVILVLFVETVQDDAVAYDFRVFYEAADAILHGDSPYVGVGDVGTAIGRSFVYPPLTALASIPLTVLPFQVAGLVVQAGLVVAILGALRLLGVRDWRCYGVVLLWPPVLSAIQTGSVTIVLVLAAAVAWRYRTARHRRRRRSALRWP